MGGNTGRFVKRLERRMNDAATDLDFEAAARLRDDLTAMHKALERTAVVLPDGTDTDVVGIAEDELELAVQVFHVRGGRIRGQRGWVADKVDDASRADHVQALIMQLYAADADTGDAAGLPREILVPELPTDVDVLSTWLSERRGSQVAIRVPHRGDKASLARTVTQNAEQGLRLHKTKRASDLSTRNRALEQIAESLELEEVPLRIECYDVSNLQETNVVASMVVFEDGLPRKSDYRRFSITGTDGSHDTAALAETLRRRFRRYLMEQRELAELAAGGGEHDEQTGLPTALIDPESGRRRRFAYAPGLVVVDGGQPQVAAAREALDELGLQRIPVCGLAKRLEEVWIPGEDDPLILPRTSEGLYLLQRVRDEAHRFAITYHRAKRSRSMTMSVLDEVPGLGDSRKRALIKAFGSLKKVRTATATQIAATVPGIGPATAAAVVSALATDAPGVSVNTATGEILDN
jgi:excinuclease ABC subunit C